MPDESVQKISNPVWGFICSKTSKQQISIGFCQGYAHRHEKHLHWMLEMRNPHSVQKHRYMIHVREEYRVGSTWPTSFYPYHPITCHTPEKYGIICETNGTLHSDWVRVTEQAPVFTRPKPVRLKKATTTLSFHIPAIFHACVI